MSVRSCEVRYTVRADVTEARALLEGFLSARGWTARPQADGTIAYERGSRRRTILLGALAGRRFHLTAVTEVREGDHTSDIHYRWGPGAGRTLGGTLGRDRADRAHAQTAAELETHLERDGRLLRVRR